MTDWKGIPVPRSFIAQARRKKASHGGNAMTKPNAWRAIRLRPKWVRHLYDADADTGMAETFLRAAKQGMTLCEFVDVYPAYAAWMIYNRALPRLAWKFVDGIISRIADIAPRTAIDFLWDRMPPDLQRRCLDREPEFGAKTLAEDMPLDVMRWFVMRHPAAALRHMRKAMPPEFVAACARLEPRVALKHAARWLPKGDADWLARKHPDVALRHASGKLSDETLDWCAQKHPELAARYVRWRLSDERREWCDEQVRKRQAETWKKIKLHPQWIVLSRKKGACRSGVEAFMDCAKRGMTLGEFVERYPVFVGWAINNRAYPKRLEALVPHIVDAIATVDPETAIMLVKYMRQPEIIRHYPNLMRCIEEVEPHYAITFCFDALPADVRDRLVKRHPAQAISKVPDWLTEEQLAECVRRVPEVARRYLTPAGVKKYLKEGSANHDNGA